MLKLAKYTLIIALFLRSVAFATVATCTITGEVDDAAGDPLANASITFNTLYTQVVSGNTIQQTLVSTTTDADGQLNPIALAQGVYVQINVNGGAPITAIVPFAASTTFSALISNIVTNPVLTQIILTGLPTTSQPTCNTDAATLYYDTTTGLLELDTNCTGYYGVLTAANALPDCQDTGGNHINYIASTHMLTCGNTSSGGGGGGGSPPFSDGTALVMNGSDNTKRLTISAASISTATTRTLTAPDRDATIATSSGTLTSGNLVKFDASGNVVDDGIAIASLSGNTTKVATVSGSVTSTHGAVWDASGNLVDSGSAGTVKQFTAGGANTLSQGSTQFFPPMGYTQGGSSTEQTNFITMPLAGTFKNLYCLVTSAPGSAKSRLFRYRKNGAATILTCTISGSSATTCSDTSNSITVVAGDTLSVLMDPTGTPAAAAGSCGAEFDPS